MPKQIVRRGPFTGGWQPSSDANNAPADALLRMDNLVLDDRGMPVIRKGVTKLDTLSVVDAHSLFTAFIGGTKYRMSAAGNNVYRDGSSILTLGGSGDVSFGSFMGQIFIARGNDPFKDDGSGSGTFAWGISAPGGAPTLAARSLKTEVVTTCVDGEADSTWTDEPSGATLAHVADRDGDVGPPLPAIQITTDGDGRGFLTNLFGTPKDTTDFGLGSDQSSPHDTFQFYVWTDEPESVTALEVLIDVDSGNFVDDYYFFRFEITTTGAQTGIPSIPTPEDIIFSEWGSLSPPPQEILDQLQAPYEARLNQQTTINSTQGILNAGWNKILIPRSAFFRAGSTTGKNWTTVKGIKLNAVSSTGGAIFKFDDVEFHGSKQGTLLGEYQYAYQLVRPLGETDGGANAMEYEVLSPISPVSAVLRLESRGVTVTIPAQVTTDTQVTEVWIYRAGASLGQYYRVGTVAYVDGVNYNSGATAATFEDLLSDIDVLTLDIPLEPNTSEPPHHIIDIEGPHYDRLFCLDATTLYPSNIRKPDNFDSGEEILVADTGETAYWVKRAFGNLYVGTSDDIYMLQGTFTKRPDGTIDVRKVPLNIGNPPISKATAQEGNNLVYLAADGWRLFNGHTGSLLVGDVELLYKGETRHGVSAVNITNAASRFRAAIANGRLTCLTPEGSDTTKSKTLHRYDLRAQKWFRHTWGLSWSWQNVYREPDGTLIGCDDAGAIWELDTANADDTTNEIAVTIWTRIDDMDLVGERKDFWVAVATLYTGAVEDLATLSFHDDGASAAALSKTAGNALMAPHSFDISEIGIGDQSIQLRLTGDFNDFQFDTLEYHFLQRWTSTHHWEERPENPSLVRRRFGGFTVFTDTLGSAVTATPIDSDGNVYPPQTINTGDKGPTPVRLLMPDVITRDMWLRLEATGDLPFELGDVVAITYEDMPQQFQGLTPSTDLDHKGPKLATGLNLSVCSLGKPVEVVPYLDGEPRPDLTFTIKTGVNEAVGLFSQFPGDADEEAVDFALFFRDPVELYGWSPEVISRRPEKVHRWERRPETPCPQRRRFAGGHITVDTGGVGVDVIPVLDDVALPALKVTTADVQCKTKTFPSVVGHDLWFRLVNPDHLFQVYTATPLVLETFPEPMQGHTPSKSFDTDEQKVISGVELRYCTRDVDDIDIRPTFDGVIQSEVFRLPNDLGKDEFQTHTINFDEPMSFTEMNLFSSDVLELVYWKPVGLYTRPAPKRVWDSGPIDMNGHDLNWIREVRLKGIFPTHVELKVFFEGESQIDQIIPVPVDGLNQMTEISTRVPRTLKGRQPQFQIRCSDGSEFYPEWLDFWLRPSGNQGRRKGRRKVRVKA